MTHPHWQVNRPPPSRPRTRARSEHGEPLHHWSKRPLTVAMLVVFVAMAVLRAVDGDAVLAVACALVVVLAIVQLRLVAIGRNPWWMRSRFDGR